MIFRSAAPVWLRLLLDRRVKVHDCAAGAEKFPVFVGQNSSTSGREHDVRLSGQRLDDFLLAAPEPGLTLFLEYERDIDTGPVLDLGITVQKRKTENFSQVAADR